MKRTNIEPPTHLYSVTFDPQDTEYPGYSVEEHILTIEHAVLSVFDDILQNRRPCYCDTSAYTITEIDCENDDYINWTMRADELMAERGIDTPKVKTGDYVATPKWLSGKQSTKKPTCVVSRIASRRFSQCALLIELTRNGPSTDMRRRHWIRLDDLQSLSPYQEWRTVGNRPVTWIRSAVKHPEDLAEKVR